MPVIPRQVADAIEGYRKIGGDNEDIMRMRFGAVLDIDERFRSIPFDTLLVALVNGYTVEKTAKELRQDAYENIRIHYDVNDPDKLRLLDSRHYAAGYRIGVKDTLKALGITISGVNSPEGVSV
jgi:hypothetical protein